MAAVASRCENNPVHFEHSRKKNLIARALDGYTSNRLTIFFDDPKRQRIKHLIDLQRCQPHPNPGFVNVVSNGFAVQQPKIFPVVALTGSKAGSHPVNLRHNSV
jgi:hypothetical protein